MPHTPLTLLGRQVLQQARRGDWRSCLASLQNCATSGEDLREVPTLSPVLRLLVEQGHWRDVLQLHPLVSPNMADKHRQVPSSTEHLAASPSATDSRTSASADEVVSALLHAATCPGAVASADPQCMRLTVDLIHTSQAALTEMPSQLVDQVAAALRSWRDVTTTEGTFQRTLEATLALVEACRHGVSGESVRAADKRVSALLQSLQALSVQLGEMDAATPRPQQRSLPEPFRHVRTTKSSLTQELRAMRDGDSVVRLALALHHAVSDAPPRSTGGVWLREEVACWAADVLLAERPSTPEGRTPTELVLHFILATTRLVGLDHGWAHSNREGPWLDTDESCSEARARAEAVLCQATRALCETRDDARPPVWHTLQHQIRIALLSPDASSTEVGRDCALAVLTDAACALSCRLSQSFVAGGLLPRRAAESEGAVAMLLEAVSNACAPHTSQCCPMELRIATMLRVWTALVGEAGMATLCPEVLSVSPIRSEQTPTSPLSQNVTTMSVLTRVASRMADFAGWMHTSADVILNNATSAAATELISLCVAVQNGIRLDTRDATTEESAQLLRDADDGDDDEDVLLSETNRKSSQNAKTRRADSDHLSSSCTVDSGVSDTLASWYARIIRLVAEGEDTSSLTVPLLGTTHSCGNSGAERTGIQILIGATPELFARQPENSLRVAVALSLISVASTAHRDSEVNWQRAVHGVHAFLLALPSSVMTAVALRLHSMTPNRDDAVSSPSSWRDVQCGAAVLRLAATAALQHPRSALALDDKAEAVRTCLASFPSASPHRHAPHTLPTSVDATLLLLRCDPAGFQRQHEATQALAAVVGATVRLTSASSSHTHGAADRASARPCLRESNSSLDQLVHALVERGETPHWAEALAVVTEASLATTATGVDGAAAFTRLGKKGTWSVSHASDIQAQVRASLIAADRDVLALPLASSSSAWPSQSDADAFTHDLHDLFSHAYSPGAPLLSLSSQVGTPLSEQAHNALREELAPLRAGSRVKAAIEVFYRLERDNVRLSLAELEWFAFAVKRGPLVFAVRVLAYLEASPSLAVMSAGGGGSGGGQSAEGSRARHGRDVSSRSLGMAALQCAANVYMRARAKARGEGRQKKPGPRGGAQAHSRSRSPSAAAAHELRLVGYQCRILAAQSIRLLPHDAGDTHAQAQRHTSSATSLSDHGHTDSHRAASASQLLSSLNVDSAEQNDDVAAPHAATDFQRIVTAVRRLCERDGEAMRVFLTQTGAYALPSVQEAVEVLEHTVSLCVEVGDRETAVRAYLRFRETWARAPVPLAVLLSLLRLESSRLQEISLSHEPHFSATQHDVLTVGAEKEDDVMTTWASSPRRRSVGNRQEDALASTGGSGAVPVPSAPSQLITILQDGLLMARVQPRSVVATEGCARPWCSATASFLTAAFEVIFAVQHIPSLCMVSGDPAITAQDLLAIVITHGNGYFPTARFVSAHRDGHGVSSAIGNEVLEIATEALTCSADPAAVVEGASVVLGLLPCLFPQTVSATSKSVPLSSASDAGTHALVETCRGLLNRVAAVLRRPTLPPMYRQYVKNTLRREGLFAHLQRPNMPHQLDELTYTDPRLGILVATNAEVYEAVYNTLAAPCGLRTFDTSASAPVRHGASPSATDVPPPEPPLAQVLRTCEQLRCLHRTLTHMQSQPAELPEASLLVSLLAAAHMALEQVHTTLLPTFDLMRDGVGQEWQTAQNDSRNVSSLPRHSDHGHARVVDAATTIWFNASLETLVTSGALLERVEATLHAERLQPDDPEQGGFASARHSAMAHIEQSLHAASAVFLEDWLAWWRTVEALSSAEGAATPFWMTERSRRAALLEAMATLCRLELRRGTSGSAAADRIRVLASIVQPIQRAVYTTPPQYLSVDGEGVGPHADERLVVDALCAFCDVFLDDIASTDGASGNDSSASEDRHARPLPVTLRQALEVFRRTTEGAAADLDNSSAPTTSMAVPSLVWSVLPLFLFVAERHSAAASAAISDSLSWWHHAQAVHRVLSAYQPPTGSSETPLLVNAKDLEGLLWLCQCNALGLVDLRSRQAHRRAPFLVDRHALASLLPSALEALESDVLGGAAPHQARLLTAVVMRIVCDASEVWNTQDEAEANWHAVMRQLGEHRPQDWFVARYILLNSPPPHSAKEHDALATVFGNRLSTVLSSFGPWPREVLMEMALLLAPLRQQTMSPSSSSAVSSTSVMDAAARLDALLGFAASSSQTVRRPASTETGSPVTLHQSAEEARRHTALTQLRHKPAGEETSQSFHSRYSVPFSVAFITVVEALLNTTATDAAHMSTIPLDCCALGGAGGSVLQRLRMDSSLTALTAPDPLKGLRTPLAVAASRKGQRTRHLVPPSQRQPANRCRPPSMPTVTFPFSQYVTSHTQARRDNREAHQHTALKSDSVPALADSAAAVKLVSRFTSAALAQDVQALPLRQQLFRIATAVDVQTLIDAIHKSEHDMSAHATRGHSGAAVDDALERVWNASLARLTELALHQERVQKRGLDAVYKALLLPVFQALLTLCLTCGDGQGALRSFDTGTLSADILGHCVSVRAEVQREAILSSRRTGRGGHVDWKASVIADSTFSNTLAQELFPSLEGEALVTTAACVDQCLRQLLMSDARRQTDSASQLWSRSLWPPALWERQRLDSFYEEKASEESAVIALHSRSPLLVRNPIVTSEVLRALVSDSGPWPSLIHVGFVPHGESEAEWSVHRLRQAADATREYTEKGFCTVSTSHGQVTAPLLTRVGTSHRAGVSRVLDEMLALLSQWGHRGVVANARRDHNWSSVVRFVVDEILFDAESSTRGSPREGLFAGFVPSSWHTLLGLVVERIRMLRRDVPSVEYAEAILRRLQVYAAAGQHMRMSELAGAHDRSGSRHDGRVPHSTPAIRLLAFSRQNWQVLLHFFLQTHTLAAQYLSPLGWPAERQATVDTAWTCLLQFLTLVDVTGHGDVNLWTPNTMQAFLDSVFVGDHQAALQGNEDAERSHSLRRGASVVTSVAERYVFICATERDTQGSTNAPSTQRTLTARGIHGFYSGSWRRTSNKLDRRVRGWLAQQSTLVCDSEATLAHTLSLPESPLRIIEDALFRSGVVPSHAAVIELLAFVIAEASAARRDSATVAAWVRLGLTMSEMLCPFMAMSPVLMEHILTLFTLSPAEWFGTATMQAALAHFLTRYQPTELLTSVSVALLADLHSKVVGSAAPHTQKRDGRGDGAAHAELAFVLLCRTVQGLLALPRYSLMSLCHHGSGLPEHVLHTLWRRCQAFIVDDAYHPVGHDDMFIAAGRCLDECLQLSISSTRASLLDTVWFTRSVCEELADRMEPYGAGEGANAVCAPLPPLARMLRVYESFQSDRETRGVRQTTTHNETTQAVERRFLSALFALSVRGNTATSTHQQMPSAGRPPRVRALPVLSWQRALQLLFPALTQWQRQQAPHTLSSEPSTAAPTSRIAADALRLLTSASPAQQWRVAIQLFTVASASASHEAATLASSTGKASSHDSTSSATREVRDVLAYRVLRYIVSEGAVQRMPLTVTTQLTQQLLALEEETAGEEEEEETVMREQGKDESAIMHTVTRRGSSVHQVHNRRAVLATLAQAISRRDDLSLGGATHWYDVFHRFDVALHQKWSRARQTERDDMTASFASVARQFATDYMRRVVAQHGRTPVAPVEMLRFMIHCRLTSSRETQPWLVQLASLAAPTQVPAILELFAGEDGRAHRDAVSEHDNAGHQRRHQQQQQLTTLLQQDTAALSQAHTSLLSDLLQRRPKDGRTAKEAALLCQRNPALLQSDTFRHACHTLASHKWDVKLTLFFTTLITSGEVIGTSLSADLLHALPMRCVQEAVQAYNRVAVQQGEMEGELFAPQQPEPTWCAPAVLFVSELVQRLPWGRETIEKSDVVILRDALMWMAEHLLGVKPAADVMPVVLFGQPLSPAAHAAMTPFYTSVEAHMAPVVSSMLSGDAQTHAWLRHTVRLMAAVCVGASPRLAEAFFDHIVAADSQSTQETEQTALCLHYTRQRVQQEEALRQCASNVDRLRLALHWRDTACASGSVIAKEAVDASLLACTALAQFIGATAVLHHLDGIRVAQIDLVLDALDTVSAENPVASAGLLSVALHWWWHVACLSQSAKMVSTPMKPAFPIPLEHVQAFVRALCESREACGLVLQDPTRSLIAEAWGASQRLSHVVVRMAYALQSTATSTRGLRALGLQLVALLTVTQPFRVALSKPPTEAMVTRGSASHTGHEDDVVVSAAHVLTISSLKEAVHYVCEWTGQKKSEGTLHTSAEWIPQAALEKSLSAALLFSKQLLEATILLYSSNVSGGDVVEVGTLVPSRTELARVLVPQLCEDGLALTLASVTAATRGDTTVAASLTLDPHRVHLLLSSAALVHEASRLTEPSAAATPETLNDIRRVLNALRPHVLVRFSEPSLALLRLLCIRAAGANWRPLLSEFTNNLSAVSVRPAVLSPEETSLQQNRLYHALTDENRFVSYESAWQACTERRQHGLRLNWNCYAALWHLAEQESDQAVLSESPSEARWERLESWLYALLRDGLVVPDMTVYDRLLRYLANGVDSHAKTATVPNVRNLASLLSVMPHRTGDGQHRAAPISPAMFSAVVEACGPAGDPAAAGSAEADAPLLGRFVRWVLGFPSIPALPPAALEATLWGLCGCHQPCCQSGSQTKTSSALLKQALWQPSEDPDEPSWRDKRDALRPQLPDRLHVQSALELLVRQSEAGVVPSLSACEACFEAAGAVLLADSACREKVGVLLKAFLSSNAHAVHARVSQDLSPAAWRTHFVLLLAEQCLWEADFRVLRREATFARGARREVTRASHGTDQPFLHTVLRYLWTRYVDMLRRFAPDTDQLYHVAILDNLDTRRAALEGSTRRHFENARVGLTAAGTDRSHLPSLQPNEDDADADEDETALSELMQSLADAEAATCPSLSPTRVEAHTPSASAPSPSMVQAVAARLQSLREMMLHAEPHADLQYPFEVLVHALLENGRWMEAFAWVESASLTSSALLSLSPSINAHAPVQDEEDAALLLQYASLEASNVEVLVRQSGETVLTWPQNELRTPTPPVRAVSRHATLHLLLLWQLVEASQIYPAFATEATQYALHARRHATQETSAEGRLPTDLQLAQLRRHTVLGFAESWTATHASTSLELTNALVATSLRTYKSNV